MSYIDVTGKTEDEALRKGLEQLGMDRDDVSVSILERAKSGFLGIGATPARIRITYGPEEVPVEEEPAAAPRIIPEKPAEKPAEKVAEKKPAPAKPVQSKPRPRSARRPLPPPRLWTCRSAMTTTPSASWPSCPACCPTWITPPR